MEPSLGAVSAYLAKKAGPRLAAAAQKQFARRWWRMKLARKAFAELPRPRLRRVLARWLGLPVNQQVLLSPSGPTSEAVEFLDAYLGAESARWRDLSGPERRRRTEAVLSRVYDSVLREVDPSYAISIASSRSQAAAAQTQSAVTDVRQTVEEIRTAQAAAAARGEERDLQDRLRALPCLDPEWMVQRWREAPEPVWAAVTALTQPDAEPEAVVAGWQRLRPDWVVNAPVAARLAIGELAAGYGMTALAAGLFESAADDAAPRSSYWRGRAAYIHAARGDTNEARRVLGAGHVAGDTEPLSRAVASRLDGDLAAVRRVIEEWEPQTAVETVLRASLQAEELVTTSDGSLASSEAVAAALKALQEGNGHVPASTVLRMVRARLLILEVRRGRSRYPEGDLRDARDLALSARDARRTWRGNSAEPAAIACEASNVALDWEATITIGTVSDSGATVSEAAAADVQKHVAIAAVETGNLELAEQLISSIDDSHLRALLTGQLAEIRGEDAEPYYRTALEHAGNDDQRRADAILALATIGAADVPGLEELLAQHPEIGPEVEAARALAAGRRDEAIQRLRQVRRTSPTAALRLARAYADADDVDGLVDTLRDAAADFRNPQLQLNAVQELLHADRAGDAQAELDRLLTSGVDWTGRADALRLAADLASHDGQLDRATELLDAALRARPSDPAIRWRLIQIQLERGDYDAAWRVFAEADPDLLITTAQQAHAWIELQRRYGEAEEAVRGSLRLIRQFPDDEAVAGHAIAALFAGHREPLSEETLRDLHAAIDAFTTQWPDSTYFRQVSAEDPATLLQRMTELVRTSREEAQHRREIEIALAYGRLPVGIIAAISRRSYAEVVVRRGTGRLHAQAAHPAEHRLDIEQARAAMDRPVAVDTTAAAVLLALPEPARRAATGCFRRMVTTDSALRDASRGRDALASRSTDTLGFDIDADAPRIFSIEPETAERMATEAELLVSEITAMHRQTPPGHNTSAAQHDLFDPWKPLLDLAEAEGLPVWADDVALRMLARQAGLTAFPTPALLAHLADTSRITGDEYNDAKRAILSGRIGDAPLDETLLLEVAEEEGWKPGAAALALASPATWASPRTFPVYREIVHASHRNQPTADLGWLYSAISGVAFAFAHQPETVSRIAGVLLAWTIDATRVAAHP